MDDKIVVVDDDPGTIYLIGRILHGVCQLSFATSGEKALQLVHDSAPDLILLDLMMPVMSGWEVLEELQASDTLSRVPVVVVSAMSAPGVFEHLSKPIDLDDLLTTVARLTLVPNR